MPSPSSTNSPRFLETEDLGLKLTQMTEQGSHGKPAERHWEEDSAGSSSGSRARGGISDSALLRQAIQGSWIAFRSGSGGLEVVGTLTQVTVFPQLFPFVTGQRQRLSFYFLHSLKPVA